jgi:hypothetical protein
MAVEIATNIESRLSGVRRVASGNAGRGYRKVPSGSRFCVFYEKRNTGKSKTMIDFFQKIFSKAIGIVTSVVLATGLFTVPSPTLETPIIYNLSTTTEQTVDAEVQIPSQTKKVRNDVDVTKTYEQQRPNQIESKNILPPAASIPAPQIVSWTELESKYFPTADAIGYQTITITNPYGDKRYYRKEDGIWVRKNTENEAYAQQQTSPIAARTACMNRAMDQWRKEYDRLKALEQPCPEGESPISCLLSKPYVPSVESYVSDSCFSDVHTPNYTSGLEDQLNNLDRRQNELEQEQQRVEFDAKMQEFRQSLHCTGNGGSYYGGICHYF